MKPLQKLAMSMQVIPLLHFMKFFGHGFPVSPVQNESLFLDLVNKTLKPMYIMQSN